MKWINRCGISLYAHTPAVFWVVIVVDVIGSEIAPISSWNCCFLMESAWINWNLHELIHTILYELTLQTSHFVSVKVQYLWEALGCQLCKQQGCLILKEALKKHPEFLQATLNIQSKVNFVAYRKCHSERRARAADMPRFLLFDRSRPRCTFDYSLHAGDRTQLSADQMMSHTQTPCTHEQPTHCNWIHVLQHDRLSGWSSTYVQSSSHVCVMIEALLLPPLWALQVRGCVCVKCCTDSSLFHDFTNITWW